MNATKKQRDVFCGEFYSNDTDNAQFIGRVYKLPNGKFEIRGQAEFSGKTIWRSAEFAGNCFRKFRTLNLGYAIVNCYTAKTA
jgi:hypothetical protein